MATRKYAYCQEPSKIILPLTAQRICASSIDIFSLWVENGRYMTYCSLEYRHFDGKYNKIL